MKRIYHFTSFKTAIEAILPSMTLRTNGLIHMNDPAENQHWAFGGINVPYEALFPGYYSDQTHISCQFQLGSMIRDNIQVLCFSGAKRTGWRNQMMWAHYAENHRGVCLELDAGLFLQENKIAEEHLRPVRYEVPSRKPWISWDGGLNMKANLQRFTEVLAHETLWKKTTFWGKEDEMRLILTSSPDHQYLKIERSLTGIYVGLQANRNDFPSLGNLLKESQAQEYELIFQNYRLERWPTNFAGQPLSACDSSKGTELPIGANGVV